MLDDSDKIEICRHRTVIRIEGVAILGAEIHVSIVVNLSSGHHSKRFRLCQWRIEGSTGGRIGR